MDIDWDAEGLLDGLEGDARRERRDLLDLLAAEGVPLEDIRDAVSQGLQVLLLAELAIGGPARYSAEDLAAEADVDPEFMLEMRRAHGLPIPDTKSAVFHESDIDAARNLRVFIDAGLSREQLLATTRVLGRGLSQAAETMRAVALEQAIKPGMTEAELARSYATVARTLTPMMGPVIEQMLRLHLRHAFASEITDASERRRGALPGARPVTVAFADLSGFTRLGETVPADRLGEVAGRFDTLVSERVIHPVRLVKMMGDGALLVAPESEPLLDTALSLVDAAEAQGDDFPSLRVGLARGEATTRGGDWYGRPVNLASRITGVARPASVLASEEIHDELGETFAWSFAGSRQLRGIRAPVKLFRARRPAADAPSA